MRANTTARWSLFWLLIGAGALAPPAKGQVLTTAYVNQWYPRGTNQTGWAPVSTSFYGGSSDANPRTPSGPPSVANLSITQSRFGMACGAIEANYNLGQALPAPVGANTSIPPVLSSSDTNRVIWIDYDQQLYAIDQGAVIVKWNMPDGSLVPVTYLISDTPAGRPVYLYWTEPPYGAPSVVLPKGPILPTIYYNFQIVDTNMVWLDPGNGLHAATGVRGKFLLTYSSKDASGTQKLQGTEIVQVLEPLVSVQTVSLGQRLLPSTSSLTTYGTSNLTAQVTRGLLNPTTQDPASQFVYQQSQGFQNGWLYAVRKTSAPWQIEVYWMAKSLLDVVWPFEMDHYSADWGTHTQLYARGAPNSGKVGPAVQFPATLTVNLMDFQEPAGHAVLQTNSLYTSGAGYCLLKYVVGSQVAFEPVHSVYSSDPDYFDLQDWAWDIGRELRPMLPKNHGALDFNGGYVAVAAPTKFTSSVQSAQALTIEAWVCLESLQNGKTVPIVAKGTNGYNLMVTNGALAYLNPLTPINPISHLSISTGRLSTNRWSHVAVVVQPGEPGAVNFYIDGLPAGQDTFVGASVFSCDDTANPLLIGCNGSANPTVAFDGSIDEVRIWSAALPGRYVEDWMNRVITSVHPSYQKLVGQFRFEEQAGTATVGSGANGASWQGILNGNVVWEVSGAHLEEDAILTVPYGQYPGYLQFSTGDRYNVNLYQYPTSAATPIPASQIFAVNTGRLEVWWANQSLCELGLPIYWPSLVNLYTNRWPAEPAQIVIASGLGSQSETVQYGAAACLFFDGVNDYLKAIDSPSLELSDNFTLECWVKPAKAATGLLPLISKGNDEYTLAIKGGRLQFQDQTSGTTYSAANLVQLGQLSHVAVSYSAGLQGLHFYINGQPAGQSDLPLGGLKTGSGDLWIGGSQAAGTNKFSGLMDEVRLWSRVLTPSEITRNMYAAASRDDPDLRACFTFDAGDVADGAAADSSGYANHALVPAAANSPLESIPGIPRLLAGQGFAQQRPQIYYQNDPTLPGYNPNEEHALVVGDQVYALRNDFNTTNNPPYVLVQYSPPEVSPRQAIAVFKVVATNELYFFQRNLVAGTMIQPPLPLSLMAPGNCPENYCTNVTYAAAWRDRKSYIWARNAADDGTNAANITMKFYYPVQQGFAFPGVTAPPAAGTSIPWLSGPNVSQPPVDYVCTVSWPASAPVLNVIGTLLDARDGLPAIRGQKSVDILYQQSAALSANPANQSVELIDPTVMRTARLPQVAPGIKSYIDPATGYTFFGDLPPELRDRLYWNPTASPGQELQLVGKYKVMTDSQYNYLRLNVLDSSNLVAALSLPGADVAWTTAIKALPANPVVLANDTQPFDSIALSAGVGKGRGYVTLVFNNSVNHSMVQDSDVIGMNIIRVDQPMYSGMLDLILSPNPLDQQQSLRYTADFAGTPNLFEFEWQYAETVNPNAWQDYGPLATQGLDQITIGDAGIFGLSDHWIRCRYRALDPVVKLAVGTNWSQWTQSALAEGWIKRVMQDITPYEQRIKDFQNGLLTTLDMVAQAGPPYAGDIPLNLDALNQNGLIQIYQTVLEKGKALSINAGFNDEGANQALLLAAGRISDLYMLLGNEAYADALDPTIGLGTSDPVWGSDAPSIFCFMNQVPTLLDEELALLRGRDGSQSPSTDTYPVYNRLFWNFTSDVAGGEVAYALNYAIRDVNLDGFIDQTDAQALYPQGHGDAWGHYLSAIKGYYDLLHNPNFVWIPQSEQINVGTEPVGVSYLHEQRFCQSAVAKARAGALIVSDTYRSQYAGEGADTWQTMRDSNTNRCWGVAEWASRAGMGAYFDWLVGNALLPDHDISPDHSGISLIDRKTVPELPEITTQYEAVQDQVDHADGAMNPLGLADGVVPFDISPADADSGQTHFDQIYTRALDAWRNALAVFDSVRYNAQALRDQAESQDSFNQTVVEAEIDFTNRLVELYGYPYVDDIGTGRPFPQGYQGPDLLHYNYVDLQDITGLTNLGQTISVTVTNTTIQPAGDEISALSLSNTTQTVDFYIDAQGLPSKPPTFTGQRRAAGTLQSALEEFIRSLSAMRQSLTEFHQLNDEIQTRLEMLQSKSTTYAGISNNMSDALTTMKSLDVDIQVLKGLAAALDLAGESAAKFGDATGEAVPKGPLEMTAPVSGSPKLAGAIVYMETGLLALGLETGAAYDETAKEEDQKTSENQIVQMEHNLELEDDLAELRLLVNSQKGKALEVQSLLAAMSSAQMQYSSVVAEGQRLQVAQQTFRMHTAGGLQADRYRNMAFRIFRNDALQRYQAAFDLAARYVYLAAKAYDYETALPIATSPGFSGRNLMAQIARARSLGRSSIVNETFNLPEPLAGGPTGDPGLADIMARLEANWGVLQSRYGFNNPETETGRFSLRTELFRIPPGPEGDADWRTKLGTCYVTNLLAMPEFNRYCLPFDASGAAQPALVIPFESCVRFGKNFFGLDLAAGDNAYDSSHFATKIRSAGVWFANFNNAFNVSPDHGGGLANMPRVYLLPTGLDVMRIPSGDQSTLRTWTVFDQVLPVPYPLTQQDLVNPNWVPLQDSLSGGFGTLRKYPAMRAYQDAGFDVSQMTYSSRLIGRSVWNTQWLLVIPGGTLLNDGAQGIQRFIHGTETAGTWNENGVKDISIFFQTYSYSGN